MGTPKAELRYFEEELAEEENWTVVQQELETWLRTQPDEKYLLSRGQARSEKDRAMLERQIN